MLLINLVINFFNALKVNSLECMSMYVNNVKNY